MVGCQRSGTTLLQSAIARAARLYTVEETHYFVHLLGGQDYWVYNESALFQKKWRSRLALMRARTHGELQLDLHELLDDPALRLRLRWRLTGSGYIKEFRRLMDAAARHYRMSGWLEKTPAHLPYVDIIQRHIPDALFIHVLRNGEDVVASIIDGELSKFEKRMFFGGIGYAVRQWNRAVEVHRAHAGKPGHLVVRYEHFVADPSGALHRILRFAGLPADSIDLRPEGAPDAAERDAAHWKAHWLAQPVAPPERKFETMFSPKVQRWLRNHLTDYEMACEELLRRNARACGAGA